MASILHTCMSLSCLSQHAYHVFVIFMEAIDLNSSARHIEHYDLVLEKIKGDMIDAKDMTFKYRPHHFK